MVNKTIMIVGKAASGKTSSLKTIKNQESWVYFNLEGTKIIPFKNKFIQMESHDPDDFIKKLDGLKTLMDNPEEYKAFCEKKKIKQINGIVIDSLTALSTYWWMKYSEAFKVEKTGAVDGYKPYAKYQDYFNNLITVKLASFDIPIIVTGHVVYNEDKNTNLTTAKVDILGALGKRGIESLFGFVLATKIFPIYKVKEQLEITMPSGKVIKNPYLHITDIEDTLDKKYVFMIRPYKTELEEMVRIPDEDFMHPVISIIDANLQQFIDLINDYYKKD